jgi:protein TonB
MVTYLDVISITKSPGVTPDDRLALTLCLAIAVHAMVILGVSFAPPERIQVNTDPIEIILVQQKSDKVPEDPTHLAQANLEGGGESEEKVSPATPLLAPFPDTTPKLVAAPPAAAEPLPTQVTTVLAAPSPAQKPEPEKRAETETAVKSKALIAKTQKAEVTKPEPQRQRQPPPAEESVETPATAPPAETLIAKSFEMASLNAEIQQKIEARAKRPRRKFISASTREYKYATYMDAWRAKVERIGTLNLPDEVRRKELSGKLILDVALKPDGTVMEVMIRAPSGHALLNDAAIRIVNLAAPFAAFPPDIKKEVDILHITRTWKFESGGTFASE